MPMNQELTVQSKQSALAVMASRYHVEPQKLLATLSATVFKGASTEELLALVVVANEYGLNPLTKEIYAFPAKGGGIVPVISIDGWINRMNSNEAFDGITFDDVFGQDGKIVSTTATIWRKDRSRPIKITEYFAECFRNTDPWRACPSRMLRHKALSQCVRVAFGFGGVYDEDEANEIANGIRDVTPEATAPVHRIAENEPVPEPPAPEPEPQPQVPDEKYAHTAAFQTITELMDEDAVPNMMVRKFAHEQGLISSTSASIKSYPAATLLAIAERWEELKTKVIHGS